jgi:hypothetical protein
MVEQEKKLATAGKKMHYRFGGRNPQPRSSPYTSNMVETKNDIFNMGATSNPAKLTKSLKILRHIQMTFKMPDNIVKAIQKMKRPTFGPQEKSDKSKCMDSTGNYNANEYNMAKFMWKEDWKLIKTKEQKYQENEANTWALVYNQCSREMKVKLNGTSEYNKSKKDNDVIALKRGIQENYVTGMSKYPVSPEVVQRILNAYVPPPGWKWRMKQDGGGDSRVMLAQPDDDTWKKNITSHKCGKKGHLAPECKSKKQPDQVHANVVEEDSDENNDENLFMQHKAKGVVNKNYLLLDNQSTVNQIANPDLLTNIRKSQKPIVVHYNAGKTKTDLEGKLGDMTVHHNPKSIANVLSLLSVKQKQQVTYNSWDQYGVFVVHMPKGVVEFTPSEKGLHYINVSKEGDLVHHMLVHIETNNDRTSSDEEFVMVNTVRGNFEGYTMHNIKKAQEARRLQGMIGNPTERKFKGMVREKLIANCPVTVRNIQNAH